VFTAAFPILTGPDLPRALTFYRDLLGTTVTYRLPSEGEPTYVALDLGGSHLGLGHDPTAVAGGTGQRCAMWVYADDCDAAVELLRAAGVRITAEPESQPWGERVARVQDPDGNEVIIGTHT
jgi:lactoylglutathione lyase